MWSEAIEMAMEDQQPRPAPADAGDWMSYIKAASSLVRDEAADFCRGLGEDVSAFSEVWREVVTGRPSLCPFSSRFILQDHSDTDLYRSFIQGDPKELSETQQDAVLQNSDPLMRTLYQELVSDKRVVAKSQFWRQWQFHTFSRGRLELLGPRAEACSRQEQRAIPTPTATPDEGTSLDEWGDD